MDGLTVLEARSREWPREYPVRKPGPVDSPLATVNLQERLGARSCPAVPWIVRTRVGG